MPSSLPRDSAYSGTAVSASCEIIGDTSPWVRKQQMHAGKSEADLQKQAGSPGGWCKCECLFLVRKVGRQERTIESPSENGKQDGLSHVGFQQKEGR